METRKMLENRMFEVMDSSGGGISPKKLSQRLRIPLSGRKGLTGLVNLHRNTLTQSPHSAKVQERLGEIAKILAYAEKLNGDVNASVIWFRYQPLQGFDNKTAEDLVRQGHAEAVMKHLESLFHGGYG